MNYKASCANCKMKMSRWHLCTETTLFYRCRGCGTRMTLTSGSWVVTFAAIALVIGCYFLYREGVLSRSVAIAFILTLLIMAIWLSPHFLSFKVAPPKTSQP